MHQDYVQMKSAFSDNEMLGVEPMLVFGLEPLREILVKDDALTDEVAIAALLAKDLGLTMAPVSRVYSREKNLPWLLPYKSSKKEHQVTLKGAIEGVQILLKANDRLAAYMRWLEDLKPAKELPPLRRG